jgi:hypothetical protein
MTEGKVLVRDRGNKPTGSIAPDTRTAWKWVGWFGLMLATVGLSDFALAWYPMNWGSPEWEFATVTSSYSGLPLPTMGLIALMASAVARGVRWQVMAFSIGLIAWSLVLVLGFTLFLTTVPVALGAVQGIPLLGIKKAVVKTTILTVAFAGSYLVAGIVGIRHLRRSNRAGA